MCIFDQETQRQRDWSHNDYSDWWFLDIGPFIPLSLQLLWSYRLGSYLSMVETGHCHNSCKVIEGTVQCQGRWTEFSQTMCNQAFQRLKLGMQFCLSYPSLFYWLYYRRSSVCYHFCHQGACILRWRWGHYKRWVNAFHSIILPMTGMVIERQPLQATAVKSTSNAFRSPKTVWKCVACDCSHRAPHLINYLGNSKSDWKVGWHPNWEWNPSMRNDFHLGMPS